MAKKNDKPSKPDTGDKPKKPARKPSDPNKVKRPWAARQLERVQRMLKSAGKLQKRFASANAPGGIATMMDDAATCLSAISNVLTEHGEFKPVVRAGNKAKVGDTIVLLPEAANAPIFKGGYATVESFAGSVIVADDRVYWIVKSPTGETKAIAKKLVAKAA